tara:strand:+ start:5101 stop:6468 length:1368 start_codon:yes stop_codon:yes gene_type:complete
MGYYQGGVIMFFDIIKNNGDDAKLTSDYQRFTQLVSDIKLASSEVEQEIQNLSKKTGKMGGIPLDAERIKNVLRSWMDHYGEDPVLASQKETIGLLFPGGYDFNRDDRPTNKVMAILLSEYMYEQMPQTFDSFIDRGDEYLTDLEERLLSVFNKRKYEFVTLLDAQKGTSLIDILEKYYSELYNIFSNNSLDLIDNYLLHRDVKYPTINYGRHNKQQLKILKSQAFTNINKSLAGILSVKDKVIKVISIISNQFEKMEDLFEILSKTGAKVQIEKYSEEDGYIVIKIQKGKYSFITHYEDLLNPTECPRLRYEPTGGSVCIQSATLRTQPMFDSIWTTFALINSGEKNMLPLLDYFIYLSEVGYHVYLNETMGQYSFNIESGPLSKEPLLRTFRYFNNKIRLDNNHYWIDGLEIHRPEDHRSSVIKVGSELPPINTFINRFRVERKRYQKRKTKR